MESTTQINVNVSMIRRMLAGSSATLCALSLVFFFLPWLKLSCSGNPIAEQSGYQILTGAVSKVGELAEGGETRGAQTADDEKKLSADLGLIAFLIGTVVSGAAALGLTIAANPPQIVRLLPLGAGVAVATLLAYMAIGFSMEREVRKSVNEQQKEKKVARPARGDPFEGMGEELGSAMARTMIKVEKTSYYLMTLVFTILAFAAGIAAFGTTFMESAGKRPHVGRRVAAEEDAAGGEESEADAAEGEAR